jgi:hypothetical protein
VDAYKTLLWIRRTVKNDHPSQVLPTVLAPDCSRRIGIVDVAYRKLYRRRMPQSYVKLRP